jgi:hypothetical protein
MSDKKQTAVEWIGDNIQFDMTYLDVFGLIRQAIKMEKQQIIDAHINGHNAPSSTLKQYDAEQYYKETYEH